MPGNFKIIKPSLEFIEHCKKIGLDLSTGKTFKPTPNPKTENLRILLQKQQPSSRKAI